MILSQRNDFLRPDSLLAIMMLTDENDCSVRVPGDIDDLFNQAGTLPRARKGVREQSRGPVLCVVQRTASGMSTRSELRR